MNTIPPPIVSAAARLLTLWRDLPHHEEPIGKARTPVDIDLDALASVPSVHWLEDGWTTRPSVTTIAAQLERSHRAP
jgi:hypothetical protein